MHVIILLVVILLGLYSTAAYAYVLNVVYEWTLQPAVGLEFSWTFFVGVVFMVNFLKSGLSSRYANCDLDSAEGRLDYGSKLLVDLAAPWIGLLIVWLLVQ